jgi:type II secretion system protein I
MRNADYARIARLPSSREHTPSSREHTASSREYTPPSSREYTPSSRGLSAGSMDLLTSLDPADKPRDDVSPPVRDDVSPPVREDVSPTAREDVSPPVREDVSPPVREYVSPPSQEDVSPSQEDVSPSQDGVSQDREDVLATMQEVTNRTSYNKGLTLIEVLIALLIISVSLTALISSANQNIANVSRIKDHEVNNIVAMQAVTMLQLNLIPLHKEHTINEITTVFGKKWYWQAKIAQEPVPRLEQILIYVSPNPSGPFVHPTIAYRYNP